MMRFIVCYDVSDNKKRNKLSKLLKAFGIRTQYSVFEIETSKATILKLIDEVEQIIDEIDKFFVYTVDESKIKNLVRIGVAEDGKITEIL